MAAFRTVLLLALLPGLLLRGGVAWRSCACAAQADVPACCAPAQPGCCCAARTVDSETDADAPALWAQCGCKTLATAWRAPVNEPSSLGLNLPAADGAPATWRSVVLPTRATVPVITDAPGRGRPPPNVARNLPLRI